MNCSDISALSVDVEEYMALRFKKMIREFKALNLKHKTVMELFGLPDDYLITHGYVCKGNPNVKQPV